MPLNQKIKSISVTKLKVNFPRTSLAGKTVMYFKLRSAIDVLVKVKKKNPRILKAGRHPVLNSRIGT